MNTPTRRGRRSSASAISRAAAGVTRRCEEQKWKPIRSAPAPAAAPAPPGSRIPQILTSVIVVLPLPLRGPGFPSLIDAELPQLGGLVGGAHQRLADQDGV